MSSNSPIIVTDRAVPLCHFSFTTSRGTSADPVGKEGATLLLMRLLRRSIIGMTTEEIDEKFDSMGGTLGLEVSRSVVGFHGGVISRSEDEFLSLAQRVLTTPDFSPSEFERLREEAIAEWVESLDSDSTVARRIFAQHLFEGHDYGRLPTGTPASLKNIHLDDLKTIYSELFVSSEVDFAFAGDVDEKKCLTFTRNVKDKLGGTEVTLQATVDPSSPQGRRLVFVDKPRRTQTQILIGGLGTHPQDADHHALFVGHTIFGGTFSARLSREVRGKRGWSYGAYSSLPFDRNRQAFSLWTFPAADDAASCIKLELDMLEKFVENGVNKKELAAAKKYLINSHVFSVDTAAKRASLTLDERNYELPANYYRDYVETIRALTLEEVNAAIERRLSWKNLLIVVLGTESEIGSGVHDAVKGLRDSQTVRFNQGV